MWEEAQAALHSDCIRGPWSAELTRLQRFLICHPYSESSSSLVIIWSNMLGLARAAVKQPLRLTVLTKTCRSTATRYMHTARHIAAPTCSARFTVALRAFHHTSQWTPARSISTTHSLKKSKKNVTSGTPPSPKLSQVDPQPEPASSGPSPKLAPPAVGRWLLMSSGLVFAIVVVGGLTRLTESGLSITEWKPITGTLPPLSQAAWEEEFDKYRATPEFKM